MCVAYRRCLWTLRSALIAFAVFCGAITPYDLHREDSHMATVGVGRFRPLAVASDIQCVLAFVCLINGLVVWLIV